MVEEVPILLLKKIPYLLRAGKYNGQPTQMFTLLVMIIGHSYNLVNLIKRRYTVKPKNFISLSIDINQLEF